MRVSRFSRASLPLVVQLVSILLPSARRLRALTDGETRPGAFSGDSRHDQPICVHRAIGIAITTSNSPAAPNEASKRSRWSDSQIFDALHTASTYEYPLSTTKYDALLAVGEIDGPTASRIGQRFGSWATACDAAGVEARPTPHSFAQSRWTDADLLQALRRFTDAASGSFTTTAYDVWRRAEPLEAPSSSLIGIRFGSWQEAKRRAAGRFVVVDERSV